MEDGDDVTLPNHNFLFKPEHERSGTLILD